MGLMDAINAGLQNGMQSPLFNLGTGLIAGAQPFQNPGAQLQASAAATQAEQARQQQLYMNNFQMQMMQQQMPMLLPILQRLGGLMGEPQKSAGKAPKAPPSRGLMDAPAPPPLIAATPQQLASQSSAAGAAPVATAAVAPGTGGGGTAEGLGANDALSLARYGAGLSLFPMFKDAGANIMKLGQMQAQYNPQLAAQMAAAKSAVAQDQALLAQAQQNGAPPSVVQGLQTKLATDLGQLHIGSMSGILTRQMPDGSWTTTDPRTGLATNTVSGSTLMPGAASAQQAMAAAHAKGEAAGEVEEVTDKNGNRYYVPRSALIGGGAGASGTASPDRSSGLTPFQASVGPATEEVLKGKGEQAVSANTEYQSQAEAGQQMLAQIAQLKGAANDFAPGQFADTRIKALQWMQSLGLISQQQAKSLGSAQEGTKIAIQLQAAATKQLGSREAAQIFQIMGKSLPNLTLSQDGLSKVSSYMAGIARYNMARAQVAQQHLDANDANGVNDVRDTFIKNTNPVYYIVASAPPQIQKEMVASMGSKSRSFLENWQKAAQAGWAPRPQQYASEP